MPLETGQTLLHYRLVDKIGEGGMGVVWKAEDTTLRRDVAIKVLPEGFAAEPGRLERFEREARLLASVNHPNIATIHGLHEARPSDPSTGSGTSTGSVRFLVMEYVDGEDLSQRLSGGALPLEESIRIVSQVAEALETAHSNGIIHRDLKPANIMLTSQGHAKVMDFGLAKRTLAEDRLGSEDSSTESIHAQSLTSQGTPVGTLAYMSPEQLRAERLDWRSDLFSLGIVLYEMVTGVHPFRKPQAAETISGICRDEPPPLQQKITDVPQTLELTIRKLLAKEPDQRFEHSSDLRDSLQDVVRDMSGAEPHAQGSPGAPAASRRGGLLRALGGSRVAALLLPLVAVLIVAGFWLARRQSGARWARNEALPEIERLANASWRDFTGAYALAVEAERHIPNDPRLAELFARCSLNVDVTTEPAGTEVFVKNYATPADEWGRLGLSPLHDVRLPLGILRWKIEKPGHETVLAASSTWDIDIGGSKLIRPNAFFRALDPEGSAPAGMVRVQGAETPLGKLDDFFIDRFEVTNQQFKEFVDREGYANREYWRHEFIEEGSVLTWDQAMTRFVDRTDRPGPAGWQAGAYPEGRADHPVCGISWYEAAAYAEFAGKSLPTGTHWDLARGASTTLIRFPQLGGYAILAPFSNFGGRGPIAVGSLPGITAFGVYDMAGNVREWCLNETQAGRLVRGGAWSDATYMFQAPSQLPPMDRSPQNGFRCAHYPDPESLPPATLGMVPLNAARDYYAEKPVSDAIFEVYKERFAYDRGNLNARTEWKKEDAEAWVHEKVTFDAAYGGERVIAHLFLPRNASPPYQTVIYFPGSASLFHESSEEIENYYEFPVFLSFFLNSGRAVLYPVYKGTFERRDLSLAALHQGGPSHRYTEFAVELVKDFRRSIDYLETRPDIDQNRLAFYGLSWGGLMAGMVTAVEGRLQASVVLSGGVPASFVDGEVASFRPEADPLNYLPRVSVPTLMLNGRHDMILPLEQSIRPMFDLLGVPDDRKKLLLFDTDHIPPRNEFIKESLAWLDRWLGPVSHSVEEKTP